MHRMLHILNLFKQYTTRALPDNLDLSLIFGTALSLWHRHKILFIKSIIPVFIVVSALYSCSSSQKLINKNLAEIFQISDEIRLFYSTKPDYWGLSAETILQNNMLSPQFIKNHEVVISGAKKPIIGNGVQGDIVMPQSPAFDISLSALTKAQCISFVEANISANNLVKLIKISILNNSGTYVFEWGGANALPVKKYTAKSYCTDKDNAVMWTLR